MLHDHDLDYGWSGMGELPRRARDARAGAQRRAARRPRHRARRREGHAPGAGDAGGDRARWPTWCAPRSTRARSGCPPASATRPASSPISTSCSASPRRSRERRGVYTSHARSYIALDRRADARSAADQPAGARRDRRGVARARRQGAALAPHLRRRPHLADHRPRPRALRPAASTRASTSPATRSRTSAATRRWSSSCRRGR